MSQWVNVFLLWSFLQSHFFICKSCREDDRACNIFQADVRVNLVYDACNQCFMP